MRKEILLSISFLLILFAAKISIAQWQSDVRLTVDPAVSSMSFNNARCMAADGSIIHIVWQDNRDGNNEIYYKRSTDGGINWGSDIRLTNNSNASAYPSIAVSGSFVHVVWQDNRDGNNEIYYKGSNDSGLSWGPDKRLTNNASFSLYPSNAVSGPVIHVVWEDYRDGNAEIYYKSSTDVGISWGSDTRLTNNSWDSWYPSVSVSGTNVHVVWWDDNDSSEIYYKRSTDAGVSWSTVKNLTNNVSYSSYPSIAVSGSRVNVVWQDDYNSIFEIYYKGSTDAGVSWSADAQLTNDTAFSYYPSMAVSGPAIHIVWEDYRNGNAEIYYKRSTDAGLSWSPDMRLTNNSAFSWFPFVAVSGSVAQVLWCDDRDGNFEIYSKRDPTGNPIGISNISSGIPEKFELRQNYPNPFNPSTKITFSIPGADNVKLTVFDLLGREVSTLVSEQLRPGNYEIDWDGSRYSSGVYYYKLSDGDFVETRKMILLK
jgi:hypothetical protein